jgi:predicted DCC family thiol-disulfide oxidoreductase YuxK
LFASKQTRKYTAKKPSALASCLIMNEPKKYILLFDGVCNLCNGAVQTIIKFNHLKNIQFASLQSNFAQDWLRNNQLPTTDFSTFILLDGNKIYTQSDAALKIAQQMGIIWKLAGICWLFPKSIRNKVYMLVSNNRYKWFGKRASCMIPSPELKARFLD